MCDCFLFIFIIWLICAGGLAACVSKSKICARPFQLYLILLIKPPLKYIILHTEVESSYVISSNTAVKSMSAFSSKAQSSVSTAEYSVPLRFS